MKKLEFRMLKSYNKVIALVLSLLGFTGCEDVLNTKAEYGVPHADFIINGKIQSKITNQSIPNIRIIVKDTIQGLNIPLDTVYSNAQGNYEAIVSEFPLDRAYLLSVSDIDGVANGEFIEKDTLAEFKNPIFTGGDGHWYDGKTTKIVDIKLTPKP
jgi:putative lipoprotein (rSAM/lipoprotein system)